MNGRNVVVIWQAEGLRMGVVFGICLSTGVLVPQKGFGDSGELQFLSVGLVEILYTHRKHILCIVLQIKIWWNENPKPLQHHPKSSKYHTAWRLICSQ
jgi:hypothetical protein